jgi:hypothetical protein
VITTKNERVVPGPVDPEDTVNDFLPIAELVTEPDLARLYTYILEYGPVEIEAIKTDLNLPHSTTYKYVGRLEEMGILTRHDEERPTTVTVDSVHVQLETEHGPVAVTPVLVDAIGRQVDTEDIRVFVERQGVPKLAAALHYTHRVNAGELTQRTATNKLDVHPVEGMTVITALQDVIEDAVNYDPFLEYADE